MLGREREPLRVGRCGARNSCRRAATSSSKYSRSGLERTRVVLARSGRIFLKLLITIADNSFVQRSTIITGVMLSLGAVTLAGVGEWATGGFRGWFGAGDPSSYVSAADYDGAGAVGVSPGGRSGAPGGSGSASSGTSGFTIRRSVDEVRLQFTVADETGKPVLGLSPGDVRVLDDHAQVERFQDFTRDENLPLRLGIVLDASDSVHKELTQEKATALAFLQQVLRPQSDRAFLMTFGSRGQVWTAEDTIPQLANQVDRLALPSYGTNLYDAVYDACNEHLWQHHEAELCIAPLC